MAKKDEKRRKRVSKLNAAIGGSSAALGTALSVLAKNKKIKLGLHLFGAGAFALGIRRSIKAAKKQQSKDEKVRTLGQAELSRIGGIAGGAALGAASAIVFRRFRGRIIPIRVKKR